MPSIAFLLFAWDSSINVMLKGLESRLCTLMLKVPSLTSLQDTCAFLCMRAPHKHDECVCSSVCKPRPIHSHKTCALAGGAYDEDDKDADSIWDAVDSYMDERRRVRQRTGASPKLWRDASWDKI
eukprot:1161098-Pelagomonas_calceolata.AAC.12